MDKDEVIERELIKEEIKNTERNAICIINMSNEQIVQNKQNICDCFIRCKQIIEMLFEKYKNEYEIVEKLQEKIKQLEQGTVKE